MNRTSRCTAPADVAINPEPAARRVPRGVGRTFVLVLAGLAVGCADQEPAPASHPVVSWNADDLEAWSLAEDADFLLDEDEVGFLAGTPAGILGASGLVVVADPGNHRILVLDSLGRLQRTIGRRGQGPLEFLELRSMSAWPGDSVLAFDYRNGPSVFSPETGEGRTVRLDGMFPPNLALSGPDTDQLWLVEGQLIAPGQYEAGRQRLPISVARWQPPDSVVRVTSVAGSELHFGPGGRGFSKPPVRYKTSVAAGSGLLFVSEGDPRLTVLDATGAVQLEVQVAGTGVELTGDVRQQVTDSLFALVALTRIRMEKRLEKAPLPDNTAGFDVTMLARDGSLWLAGRSIPGIEERLWINLEQDGSPLRRLTMPRSIRVLDGDGNRLLLRAWDDLGLHHVEVRRIVPRSVPANRQAAVAPTRLKHINGKSLGDTPSTNGGSPK